MKSTQVELISDSKVVRSFEISHAERILRVHNGGWHLPEDSDFIFIENGLRYKTDKGRSSRAKKT